ncbi:MAG: NCS2 family permease [Candidatus Coatesbacteria bacterium]|nr:NCS2 family permease [Candidatus Coatesbacteria bacterium]
MNRLDRTFSLTERGTTLRRELLAGVTTFLTMAYIIVVNPQFLNAFGAAPEIGWPVSAGVTATCLASGLMSILMGALANYPIALASGMGLNAIALSLAYTLGGFGAAMGVFVIEGLVITILVLTRVREKVMHAIPMPLKHAIAVGIGLFLTVMGLQNGGIIIDDPDTLVSLGNLWSFPVLTVVLGLFVTGVLMARRVKGGILIGILFTTVLAAVANYIAGPGELGFPPGTALLPDRVLAAPDFSTFAAVEFQPIFSTLGILGGVLTIFSVMLTDFFDTMGSIVAIGEKAGFMKPDGSISRLRRILFVDSLAAAFGGLAGASSVTTYIESASGVASGGRSGLTPITVGVLFLAAVFFHPVVAVIPPQATAPALIIVGFLMASLITKIDFNEWDTALPAFLTIIVMPLAYSITDGIGVGFMTFTFLKMFQGRFKEVHPLMYVVTAGFIVYFVAPLLI